MLEAACRWLPARGAAYPRRCRPGDDMNRDPPISGQNPALPDIFGYRLQRVLGYGGMSTVYLARQISLERRPSSEYGSV